MPYKARLPALILALAGWSRPETALACKPLGSEFLAIEANPDDQEPPSPPVAELSHINRASEPERDGCGTTSSSCDGTAYVMLSVTASDDVTPAERLGYEIVVHGKKGPRSLEQPILAREGELMLTWSNDDPDDDVDVTLELWTVDEAGNRSEQSTTVKVSSSGESGCRVASRAQGAWLLALFALLALQNRRALSRARRA
jgi:hypothetical protein